MSRPPNKDINSGNTLDKLHIEPFTLIGIHKTEIDVCADYDQIQVYSNVVQLLVGGPMGTYSHGYIGIGADDKKEDAYYTHKDA